MYIQLLMSVGALARIFKPLPVYLVRGDVSDVPLPWGLRLDSRSRSSYRSPSSPADGKGVSLDGGRVIHIVHGGGGGAVPGKVPCEYAPPQVLIEHLQSGVTPPLFYAFARGAGYTLY